MEDPKNPPLFKNDGTSNMNVGSEHISPVSHSNGVGNGGGGGGEGGYAYVGGDGVVQATTDMTLEDFLEKAAAEGGGGGFGMDGNAMIQYQPGIHNGSTGGFAVEQVAPVAAVAPFGFGNGVVAVGGGSGGGGGGGRGKRRVVEEVDKATQQKQRRMIKNRESAARSRERKQAYTVELEALVMELEEENARLLQEQVELNKQRYQQLMNNLIPVIEKRKPARVLRKSHSMS